MLHAMGITGVLMFAFMLYCVLDVVLAEPMLIRNLPKLAWLLLVVVVPLIGGIAWLVAGRPETAGVSPGSRTSRRRPPGQRASTCGNPVWRPSHLPPRVLPPAPRGPDDDEDFLRRLDEQRRRPDDDA